MALSLAHQLWLRNAVVADIVRKIGEGAFSIGQVREYGRNNPAFEAKLTLIEQLLANMENPEEKAAHLAAVRAYEEAPTAWNTEKILEEYLTRWQSLPSAAAHVTEIRGCLSRCRENSRYQYVKEQFEIFRQTDWKKWRDMRDEMGSYIDEYVYADFAVPHVEDVQSDRLFLDRRVDKMAEEEWQKLFDEKGIIRNLDEVAAFLRTFKGVGKYSTKADEAIWERALCSDNVVRGVQEYENFYRGFGRHSAEAPEAANAESEWLLIDPDNIYDLLEFTEFYPDHIFHRKAEARIAELKEKELAELRRAPALYDNQTFCALYNSGACTREELCEAAGADDDTFERILNDSKIRASLPPQPGPNCRYAAGAGEPGLTDIILFGIAASGKTCVMTGLLSSENVAVDEVNYSGEYAGLLKSYSSSGVAVPGTPADFTAVVKGTVRAGQGKDRSFNFVEMAGEAFTDKIVTSVGRDGRVITEFARMDNSAAAILNNSNDKLIFLLVDPTCDHAGRREQIQAFNRLRSLMFDVPANREVMHRVKGLHFIVTKADTLGDDRGSKAEAIIGTILNRATRDALVEQCAECGINASPDAGRNGQPRIFCFSLGRFSVGNIYTYDPADSEELLSVICDYASGGDGSKAGIFSSMRDFFNKSTE